MHSEIIKTSNGLVDLSIYDNDEVNYNEQIEKLMDRLNDHGTINQIEAIEICNQRNWPIFREYDPAHYYSNNQGYLLWFEIR